MGYEGQQENGHQRTVHREEERCYSVREQAGRLKKSSRTMGANTSTRLVNENDECRWGLPSSSRCVIYAGGMVLKLRHHGIDTEWTSP